MEKLINLMRVTYLMLDNKLVESITKVRKLVESAIPSVEKRIEEIIISKETSTERIEEVLDTLLSYIHLGYGEPQFKKLNDYYSSFNREGAEAYNSFYKDVVEY